MRRPGSRRPSSASGVRSRLGSCGLEVDAADAAKPRAAGPNPFAAENAQFLRQQRRRVGSCGRIGPHDGRPARPTSSSGRGALELRQREQTVLQALDRLDRRDTLGQGLRQLQDLVAILTQPADFAWFLRFAFDERQPLSTPKARREQILMLPAVVRKYGAAVYGTLANSATADANVEAAHQTALRAVKSILQSRVFPFILGTLRDPGGAEVEAAAAKALCDLVELPLPLQIADQNAFGGFLEVCPMAVKSLMDTFVLGNGLDCMVKQRCATVLGGLMGTVLEKVADIRDDRVRTMMDNFAILIMQCLQVNPSLQEGLLNCLAQMAARQGSCIAPHAVALTELCVRHLAETPSAVPDYARQPAALDAIARSESPPARAMLTREHALACCICLRHLAQDVVAQDDAPALRAQFLPSVEAALSRENLDLQRLTRGNENLRQAIARALRAWMDMGSAAGIDSPSVEWSDEEFISAQRRDRPAIREASPVEDLYRGRRYGQRSTREGRASACRNQSPYGGAGQRRPPTANQAGASQRQSLAPAAQTDGHYRNRGNDDLTADVTMRPHHVGQQHADAACLQAVDPPEEEVLEPRPAAGGGRAAAKQLRRSGSHGSDVACETRDAPAAPMDVTKRVAEAQAAADAAVKFAREEAAARIAAVRAETEAQVAVAQAEAEAEIAQNEAARLRDELEKAKTVIERSHQPPVATVPESQVTRAVAVATSVEIAETASQTAGLNVRGFDVGTGMVHDSCSQTCGPAGRLADVATGMQHHLSTQTVGPAFKGSDAGTTMEHDSATQTDGLRRDSATVGTGIEHDCATQTWGLRACCSTQTMPEQVDVGTNIDDTEGVGTQTRRQDAICGAGRMPPAGLDTALSLPSKLVDERLSVNVQPVPSGIVLEEEAPSLPEARRHIANGQLAAAFQVVFQFGNEQTLRAVLRQLEPAQTWMRLPEAESRYLARVLARLLCKDPMAKAACEACQWLSCLLSVPGRIHVLSGEDLSSLQGALYSQSSAQGEAGTQAAALYYALFRERLKAH